MNSKLLCLPICGIASQLSYTSYFTYLWSGVLCDSIFMIILVSKENSHHFSSPIHQEQKSTNYRTKQFTITSFGDARHNGKECPSASKLIKEYEKHLL
jgi:hypothetical protein